jgi:hypothetical protein
VSELVVDLTNPESVALARKVLAALDPTTSGASANRSGGKAGGSASASADQVPPWEPDPAVGGSQIDSKPDDADPWATSAASPETPRAATSGTPSGTLADAEPSTGNDDDDPWS